MTDHGNNRFSANAASMANTNANSTNPYLQQGSLVQHAVNPAFDHLNTMTVTTKDFTSIREAFEKINATQNKIETRLARIEHHVNPVTEPDLIAAVEKAEAALAKAVAFFKARTGEVK